jgi:hypothetical protein
VRGLRAGRSRSRSHSATREITARRTPPLPLPPLCTLQRVLLSEEGMGITFGTAILLLTLLCGARPLTSPRPRL